MKVRNARGFTLIELLIVGQRSFESDSRGTIFFDSTGTVTANPIPTATSLLQ
jgi:hypothetical protein